MSLILISCIGSILSKIFSLYFYFLEYCSIINLIPYKKLNIKIHFITASLVGGGAERVLVLLANALIKKGYDVSIITFGGTDDYPLAPKINRIRLHKGKIKNHTIRRFINLFNFYKSSENRPDIIISHLPPVNMIAIIIAKLFKVKIIVSEHINHLQKSSLKDDFARKVLYRFADFTTILTKFDLKFYEKYKANVVIMPNPCSFDILSNQNQSKNHSIIAVGDLNRYHHKGFDNLIHIVAPILKKNTSWRLKILGSGENGLNLLNDLVKEEGIEEYVQFMGFRKDVKKIMTESEIFILSSRFDGLPMVLLEAMSQGMACIAYDCKTGPSDIINDKMDGLLIEDQNIKAMQYALDSLVQNEKFRRTLGDNAVNSLDRFSLENIITKWEKLFSDILL